MRCPEHFKNTCSKYVLANSSYFDGLLSKYQHGFSLSVPLENCKNFMLKVKALTALPKHLLTAFNCQNHKLLNTCCYMPTVLSFLH